MYHEVFYYFLLGTFFAALLVTAIWHIPSTYSNIKWIQKRKMEQRVAWKVLVYKAKRDYRAIPEEFKSTDNPTTKQLKSYLEVEWVQLCKMAEDKRR